MNKPLKELNAKVIIVGDPKVGKSSILIQYSEGIFETHVPMTNGIDFRFKDLVIEDYKLKLKIWDTAGQEKYRAITSNSYKGALGAILVFDIGDDSTLSNIQHWVRQIRNHAGDHIPKILLGNKCDLEIKTPQSMIDEVCNEFGLTYFETSAKINRNIAESFMFIAREIVKNAKKEESNGDKTAKDEYKTQPKIGHKLAAREKFENNDFSDFSKCKC